MDNLNKKRLTVLKKSLFLFPVFEKISISSAYVGTVQCRHDKEFF
jgi:hypothetical protein